MTRVLSPEEARRYLVAHLGLVRTHERGDAGVRRMLDALRCVQLDPLDAIGTNADLVTLARVDGVAKGGVYRATMPRHAFEHFAKERCLLPARAFPQYRDRALETPWWRLSERVKRVPASVLDEVEREVEERGPVTASELSDHGRVEPLDWQGWKGTGRMTTMALEILWTRCRVVVAGRSPSGEKRYDVPSRALPDHYDAPAERFERWALLERVAAAGLLARAGGASWSTLRDVRESDLPDELVEEGVLEEVRVAGSSRPYLALAGLPSPRRRHDGRMRILGPLDPLLWDRKLVQHAFGFDYVWEVYKPAPTRRFGWYVCPLLHEGHLVGRIEARVQGGALVVERLWREEGRRLDEDALSQALERHALACGVDLVRRRR
ncbi:MAG: winged helix DNA-binding domain-containing protein [Sandaracinaceae bacterium]|nr:winged helix DNA-binding domain-containing protein [Sandaracinaceae bacterium]